MSGRGIYLSDEGIYLSAGGIYPSGEGIYLSDRGINLSDGSIDVSGLPAPNFQSGMRPARNRKDAHGDVYRRTVAGPNRHSAHRPQPRLDRTVLRDRSGATAGHDPHRGR